MKEVNLTSTIQEVLRINETFALLLSSCPPLFGDPYFGFFFSEYNSTVDTDVSFPILLCKKFID